MSDKNEAPDTTDDVTVAICDYVFDSPGHVPNEEDRAWSQIAINAHRSVLAANRWSEQPNSVVAEAAAFRELREWLQYLSFEVPPEHLVFEQHLWPRMARSGVIRQIANHADNLRAQHQQRLESTTENKEHEAIERDIVRRDWANDVMEREDKEQGEQR